MNRQKGFGIVEIILIVAVLAAVGGVGWYFWQNQNRPQNATVVNSPPNDKTYDDACTMFSKNDVEAAFGVSFGDFTSQTDPSFTDAVATSKCLIQQVHDNSITSLGDMIEFSITVETYSDAEAAKKSLGIIKKSAEFDNKIVAVRSDVAGVGEEAFFFQIQAPLELRTEELMYARKGNQMFQFKAARLKGIDHDKAKTQLTNLARKALN